MATFLNILNSSEIKEFKSVPLFGAEDRKKYLVLTQWLKDVVAKFKTDSNKVGFVLIYGYFKAERKLYSPQGFRDRDIAFVAKQLNIHPENIEPRDYDRATLKRHREIILKKFEFSYCEGESKNILIKEAENLVSKQLKPKIIFYSLVDFLKRNRIAIPSYTALSEVITNAIKTFEDRLLATLNECLNNNLKKMLDKLLEIDAQYQFDDKQDLKIKRYKMTLLKRIHYTSTKPAKIKENIKDLLELRDIFNELQDVVQTLSLSPEIIEYYATWAKRARIFQIMLKDEEKRYLYLVAFIVHQYFVMQDVLIDILLSAVQSALNTATRKHKESHFENRIPRQKLLKELFGKLKTDFLPTFEEFEKVVNDPQLHSEEKIDILKEMLSTHKESKEKLDDTLEEAQESVDKTLKEQDYFDALEGRSRRLQSRVSEIVKELDFSEDTSDEDILDAIDYFKGKDGNVTRTAPVDFLEPNEREAVIKKENKQLKRSLYKVFLFTKMASSIKSGALNLTHSYKYKSFDEYLFPKPLWEKNGTELLKRAGMEDLTDVNQVLGHLKKLLNTHYHKTNKRINQKKNKHISFAPNGKFKVQTPGVPKASTNPISDLFPHDRYVPLSEVLSAINESTNFLNCFEHYSLKHQKEKPNNQTMFAGIIGNGCNIGIPKMAKISKGVKEYQLENCMEWYFTLDNVRSANDKVLEFINRLSLPNVFKADTDKNHTSSDGQRFGISVDSLNAGHSFKFFGKGKGVNVYTFVDDRHLLFYSTVINTTESEAAFVIDGLMYNDVVKSDIHSTDTGGYSEIIFGATHLLNFSFAPRIKNFNKQYIYTFDRQKKAYKDLGYQILPQGYINTHLIKKHWNDILRFIASIKLKETTASQLFKRLSSYSNQHPLYKALKEFGKIIKSIYLLKYIDSLELRQTIEKQLNKVENSNKFTKAVRFDKNQDFYQPTKEEQEIAESCTRLIKNSVLCWNYMYLSQLIANTDDDFRKSEIIKQITNGSIVAWKHLNFHGEYDFSEEYLTDSVGFKLPKILDLKMDKKWEVEKVLK